MRRRSDALFRRLLIASAVALLILLAAGCSEPETHPDAVRTPSGEARFRDGLYSAAYAHADADGWRPFLMLEVEAGLITSVCFDAVNAGGTRLLDDEGALERLRLERGVVLDELLAGYAATVLDTQRTVGSVEPRALEWALYFHTLLRRALEAAEDGPVPGGRAAAQQAPHLVPMIGPYVVTDQPDKLGWEAELSTIHGGAEVRAAHYLERRSTPTAEQRKRTDPLYQSQYEGVLGITFSSLADGIAASLVGTPLAPESEGAIAAVTGATLTVTRARSLAAQIAAQRQAVPLPRRLCR